MSILRLSAMGVRLYQPDEYGNLERESFEDRHGHGFIDRFPKPDVETKRSPWFVEFIKREVGELARKLPRQGPVVVMVHGFKFDPQSSVSSVLKDNDNPHGRIFHFNKVSQDAAMRYHTTGWPRGLGFKRSDRGESGLAIAYGWMSYPDFWESLLKNGRNYYSMAYDAAEESAWPLLALLDELANSKALKGRKISIVCHSLGSRVVIRALAKAAHLHRSFLKKLGQVVILGGAEYVVEASLMNQRLHIWADESDAGDDRPSFYNIVSRENDVLDRLAENFGPATSGKTSDVIGHKGLDLGNYRSRDPFWMDLQIDSGDLRHWMLSRGFDISGDNPRCVWDHWLYYTWEGNMELCKDLIRNPDRWHIGKLREAAPDDRIPEGVA